MYKGAFQMKQMQGKLLELYKSWWKEIIKTEFCGASFSNPYFCGVPEGWEESNTRVMICGQEGFGAWYKSGVDNIVTLPISEPICDSELEKAKMKLQKNNLDYVNGTGEKNYKNNTRSPFWKRFKQIQFLSSEKLKLKDLIEKDAKIPMIWNNCDKICNGIKEENGKLTDKERKKLHSTKIKVLFEEIKILKPTHIVFFGWYELALRELDNNFIDQNNKLQDRFDLSKNSFTIFPNTQQIEVYCLLHPGFRPKKGANEKILYNNEIADIVKTIIDYKNNR